jgi:hypothetical protein
MRVVARATSILFASIFWRASRFFLLARTINFDSKEMIQLSGEDRAELAASLGEVTGQIRF